MEAMGADDGLSAVTVIDRLTQHAPGFDLFQAIALLERALPDAQALGTGDGTREGIRLVAHVSLAFEPSDVRSVRENAPRGNAANGNAANGNAPHDAARRTFTLATSALTLAGANGPLPLPFTEMVIARRAARDPALADLLDIFNHRFMSFLYRGRKKHAPGLNWESPYASALAGCLDALSHLGLPRGIRGQHGKTATGTTGGTRSRDMQPWLRHAGLMGGAPRSMSGLEALLADRLGLRVSGRQFVGHWRTVERGDSVRLSSAKAHGSRVGGVHVLGRRVWDQAAGICIEFHDLPRAQFIALLPGGDAHELAVWLIHRYVQQDFEVQFVLHPAPQPVSCALSGHPHGTSAVRLGWTSWLTAARDAGAASAEAAHAEVAPAAPASAAPAGDDNSNASANAQAAARNAHASKARPWRAPAPVRFSARANPAQRA